MGNSIGQAATPAAPTTQDPVRDQRAPRLDTAHQQQAARARETVESLATIFEHGSLALRRQAHVNIGQNALDGLGALHLRSVYEADETGGSAQAEAKHFHTQIRNRITQFRVQNPDIYNSRDPELAYRAEAQFIHQLYSRLSDQFPGAKLGAACSEFAQCCFHTLRQQEPGVAIELMHLKKEPVLVDGNLKVPDHAFVVIGRNAATDPEDYTTWNSDAVVCDASKGKVYPRSDIAAQFSQLHGFTHGATRTELLARISPD